MTNKQIARRLKETADLIELTGGNPHRARAYSSAARAVETSEPSVADLARDNALEGMSGIGAKLAADIATLATQGSFALRDELLQAIPPGLPEILRVKGLGVKKVHALWKTLGITTTDDLVLAAESGRLSELPGFGAKTAEKVVEQARLVISFRGKRHYYGAFIEAATFLDELRAGGARAQLVGEMRRKMETVSEIGILVDGDLTKASAALRPYLSSEEETGDGEVLRGSLPDGLSLVVYGTKAERFGTDLFRLTGNETHLATVADRLTELPTAAEEADIYAAAGLAAVPPELREGRDEIVLAAANRLPALIEVSDLRGSVHNHSTWSDGANTIEEMGEAARHQGLEYFALCDHSRSLQIANGLSIDDLLRQRKEIDTLNERYSADGIDFRVLAGTECDILQDGSLDFPNEILTDLDLVVASVHTHFGMRVEEATERIIRAISNPYVDILGHPTGRLLLRRPGYPIDHSAVIAACAAHNVAIELNANPYRLDMDWRFIEEATAAGVKIAINPDAHSVEELDYMSWGVAVARKGGLRSDQCLNAMDLSALLGWLKARRPS
ncbi:helix-hairpin-helix domain-containing protein [soil metagenome]